MHVETDGSFSYPPRIKGFNAAGTRAVEFHPTTTDDSTGDVRLRLLRLRFQAMISLKFKSASQIRCNIDQNDDASHDEDENDLVDHNCVMCIRTTGGALQLRGLRAASIGYGRLAACTRRQP